MVGGNGSEDHAMDEQRRERREEQAHWLLQVGRRPATPDHVENCLVQGLLLPGATACVGGGVGGASSTTRAAAAFSGVSMVAVAVVIASMVGAAEVDGSGSVGLPQRSGRGDAKIGSHRDGERKRMARPEITGIRVDRCVVKWASFRKFFHPA